MFCQKRNLSVSTYYFNDLSSVIEAFDNAKGDVAAIIVAAFRWDYGQAQEICSAEFLQGVRKLCDDNGALLICDDVRSAYRISPEGTWEDKRYGHGVQPDLSCLCKGIANGQPLSVVVGNAKCRKGAENISATGSFWANSVPFASALATIPLAKAGAKKSEKMGMLLRDGLKSQANSFKSLANDFVQTGPPQMPYFHFQSESKFPLPNRHKILILRCLRRKWSVDTSIPHKFFEQCAYRKRYPRNSSCDAGSFFDRGSILSSLRCKTDR